jgi:hypothetical protein
MLLPLHYILLFYIRVLALNKNYVSRYGRQTRIDLSRFFKLEIAV